MNVEENKIVSLTYILKKDSEEGEVVEEVNKAEPFTFLYGVGNLLPRFENEIQGLKTGDNFAFLIDKEEAYGDPTDEVIIDLPMSTFYINGELPEELLQEGNYVPMKDQSGNRINGKVVEIGEENVKMDFNHPLAGSSLHFQGEIVDVREASEEEKEKGEYIPASEKQ